jgi:hypothetical protein
MTSRTILATVAVLLGLASAAGASAGDGDDLWLHVRVDEVGGAKVRVNLPLRAVESAIELIPEDSLRHGKVVMDDVEMTVDEIRAVWRDLQASPDMTFITVEDRDETVEVAKSNGYLLVAVAEDGEHGETVDVRIPASVVDALLSGEEDELEIGASLRALAAHGEGALVTVQSDDEQVRVWIDDSPEAD